MSRFFRSGDSSSSSDDDQEDIDIENSPKSTATLDLSDADAELSSQAAALTLPANTQGGAVNPTSPQWTSHHRDVLLHAMLEERSINETLKAHPNASRDAPHIQAEARARYQRLVSQLAPLHVITADLGADHHAATRQRYRDVLDVFGRQHTGAAASIRAQRLLTDGSSNVAQAQNVQLVSQRPQGTMNEQYVQHAPLTRPLGHSTQPVWPSEGSSPHYGLIQYGAGSTYDQNRYHNDFEELGHIGRGGYGIVYRARNRLDNQAYAVKKIPLSAARLHRINVRGQAELDEILLELRTLARLQHPNIVRYFHAWIEWVDGPLPGAVNSFSGSDGEVDTLMSVTGASDDRLNGHRRVLSEDEVVGNDMIFENSGNYITFEHSGTGDLSEASESASLGCSEPTQLQRTRKRSTIATASDETIETIEREPHVSMSIKSTAEGASFGQAGLALHIQMSLYPMTLADLLAAKDIENDCLHHCYHLEPSIRIATAVLDGLEYLHEEGIIHRDIKPANIFLSPTRSRGPKRDCIDVRKCSDCAHDTSTASGELDICIGDFGLAAVASPDSASNISAASSPVGTAIYRPTITDAVSSSDPSLDIYALGIVLFELLWKFDTRMERQHSICEVKEGRYPESFCEKMGEERGVVVTECIDCTLGRGGKKVRVGEVRERFAALMSTTE